MVFVRVLTLFSFVFVILIVSVSESKVLVEPHVAESFNVSLIQKLGSNCNYTVVISTSCSSTKYSRDEISIAFGDSYGNQLYAPKLEDPSSTNTFEQCASDTFDLNGSCTYQICYVYLYRSGPDIWIPESVKIFNHGSKAATFSYDMQVPENMWYGFYYCSSSLDSKVLTIGFRRFVLLLIGFIVAGSAWLL